MKAPSCAGHRLLGSRGAKTGGSRREAGRRLVEVQHGNGRAGRPGAASPSISSSSKRSATTSHAAGSSPTRNARSRARSMLGAGNRHEAALRAHAEHRAVPGRRPADRGRAPRGRRGRGGGVPGGAKPIAQHPRELVEGPAVDDALVVDERQRRPEQPPAGSPPPRRPAHEVQPRAGTSHPGGWARREEARLFPRVRREQRHLSPAQRVAGEILAVPSLRSVVPTGWTRRARVHPAGRSCAECSTPPGST